MCSVLQPCGTLLNQKRDSYNAAIELRKIGWPSVPALIELLGDRRPIRSVGFWRGWSPYRTVLRYQDAAIQILNDLFPTRFYERTSTSAYFSNERPEMRERVIAAIKSWYPMAKGKPLDEQQWLAVPGVDVYTGLHLLRTLGVQEKWRGQVVAKLQSMYGECHWIHRPCIAEVLLELGDSSHCPEVWNNWWDGKYKYSVEPPDDRSADRKADHAATRIVLALCTRLMW
jgi:hypothetical protein